MIISNLNNEASRLELLSFRTVCRLRCEELDFSKGIHVLLCGEFEGLEIELWPGEGFLSVLEQNCQYSLGLFILGVGFFFFLHEFARAVGLDSRVDGLE